MEWLDDGFESLYLRLLMPVDSLADATAEEGKVWYLKQIKLFAVISWKEIWHFQRTT